MNGELFIKTCSECGLVFRTDKKLARLCPTCKRLNEKRSAERQSKLYKKNVPVKVKRRSSYNTVPLRRFVELVDRYNRRRGTRYTYGQIMLLLESGHIRENEFYI